MAVATSGRPPRWTAALARISGYRAGRIVGQLANALTTLRLLCVVPLVMLVNSGNCSAAFYVFLGAALSDALDGPLARLTRNPTTLGAALDPIADKSILAGAFLALWWSGHVPGWFIIVLFLRDFAIVVSAALQLAMTREFRVEPLAIGKVSTALQLVLVGFILLEQAFAPSLSTLVEIGFPVVALVALTSLVIYAMTAWRGVAFRRQTA